MDVFELRRRVNNKIKIFVLFWRRIVFTKNHIPASFFTKVKANLCGGFLADQWKLYDLDMKKRREYLSELDWYRSRYINEPFDYMLNNKIITTEVFSRYIRMPEIYLVNSKGVISDFCGSVLSGEQAAEVIKERRDVFLKPNGRGKGTGVHRISWENEQFLIDGDFADAKKVAHLLEHSRDWHISETIHQHEYADRLFDKTVNTIRIITLRDPKTKRLKVFFAVQRIGAKGTIPVDNGSRGGLVCNIDLETGRLSHGRRLHDKVVYETHPDSGTRFEDMVIPDWDTLKRDVLSLAEKVPYIHFIAWDIVKLRDGQNCVIEANTSSGVNIIQLWGGQRNGELGDFYRAHGVIRK